MNERIKELASQVLDELVPETWVALGYDKIKEIQFRTAELIVRECTSLLFDESERLYGYSTECDNMRESDEAELVAEKCVDLITMIEEHFGVEE